MRFEAIFESMNPIPSKNKNKVSFGALRWRRRATGAAGPRAGGVPDAGASRAGAAHEAAAGGRTPPGGRALRPQD
jgi:hypothetical protein